MYSNNIVNFQESTTILNACTKKSENYESKNIWYLVNLIRKKRLKSEHM